jgi:hypothetical protein
MALTLAFAYKTACRTGLSVVVQTGARMDLIGPVMDACPIGMAGGTTTESMDGTAAPMGTIGQHTTGACPTAAGKSRIREWRSEPRLSLLLFKQLPPVSPRTLS